MQRKGQGKKFSSQELTFGINFDHVDEKEAGLSFKKLYKTFVFLALKKAGI